MKTWLDNDLWHVLVFSLFSGTKRKAEERRGAGGKAGAGSIIMGGPVGFMLQRAITCVYRARTHTLFPLVNKDVCL